jgi:hypothetical protein
VLTVCRAAAIAAQQNLSSTPKGFGDKIRGRCYRGGFSRHGFVNVCGDAQASLDMRDSGAHGLVRQA